MNTLLAFKEDQKLKGMMLEEIAEHRKQDQIVQGTYGKGNNGNWKGCAVGCSIHSLNRRLGKSYETSDHSVYEKELGIPRTLAYLEDRIFEGLPKEKAVLWPERFIKAIPVGADLSMVIPQLMISVLSDLLDLKPVKRSTDVVKILNRVINLYQEKVSGKEIATAVWNKLRDDAWKVRHAAYAAYAADAAYAAYAADAADAAYAAAAYAAYAAYAADAAYAYAAYAAYAADAADAAYAAYAAYAAAWKKAKYAFYEKMADKLIEILEKSK